MTQVAPQTALDLQSGVARTSILTYQPVPRAGWVYCWRQVLTALPLVAGDLLAVTLSTLLAVLVSGQILDWSTEFTICFYGLSTVIGLQLLGLYPAVGVHPAIEMKRILTLITLVSSCLLLTSFQHRFLNFGLALPIVTLWSAWLVLAPAARFVIRATFSRWAWWTQPVVFLGAGPRYEILTREFNRNRSQGLRPLGYFNDSRQQWFGEGADENDFLGDRHEAVEYAHRHNIHWAVVLDQDEADEEDETEFDPTRYSGIPHRLFQRWASEFEPSMWDDLFYLDRTSFVHQTDKLLLPHNVWLKRASDLIATAIIIIATAPVVLLIALVVKLTSRGPVFYRSERIGANGDRFTMTKFRTMQQDSEAYLRRYLEKHPERREEWDKEQKLKHDPRVTWIGGLLRRSSLDELPQIYDVAAGKMSLVGPRPMLLNEPELYGSHFPSFCRMLPGMTGLWQVSGRNRISHDQRKILVSFYVHNWSIWLDLYLLAKTVKVVITGDGAY